MKNYSSTIFLLIFNLLFSISCSTDDTEKESEMPETPIVQDDYNYVALRSDGKLYTIGDKSGMVTEMGEVQGLQFNTFFNTVTSSSTKTYIYESWFDPVEGRLSILDKESGTSTKIILNFPDEFGDNPGFMSLDWDETNGNLVGIVKEEIDSPSTNRPVKVVRIDPETFEFTVYPQLDLYTSGYENVFSTQLIGQKLYVSASKNANLTYTDLLEIDLSNQVFNVLPKGGIQTGLLNFGTKPNSNRILAFVPQLNTGYAGEVKPYIYNISTREVTEITGTPRISSLNFAHKLFYNPENGEIVELLAKDGFNLFQYNMGNGEYDLVPLVNSEDLSSGIAIIDVVKL